MSPTSFNRPIVEEGCIYNFIFFFFFFFWYMCVVDGRGGGGHFPKSEPSCDLGNGSRSPKSNQFLSLSQQYSCTSWSKSIISFWR